MERLILPVTYLRLFDDAPMIEEGEPGVPAARVIATGHKKRKSTQQEPPILGKLA